MRRSRSRLADAKFAGLYLSLCLFCLTHWSTQGAFRGLADLGKAFEFLGDGDALSAPAAGEAAANGTTPAALGCPMSATKGVCGGNGVCDNGICSCTNGYTGFDCSIRGCPNGCSGQGECFNGTCYCYNEFAGVDCSEKACPNDCNPPHGTCSKGVCTCVEGWKGDSCDTVHCPEDCNGNGLCDKGSCVCGEDYTGLACSIPACPSADEKNMWRQWLLPQWYLRLP